MSKQLWKNLQFIALNFETLTTMCDMLNILDEHFQLE